ncbi:MAG TPA: ACT domain-containing protein [Firmicutes bacterium]|nr:ACT domain-containing protein [Bacillota bacterium]
MKGIITVLGKDKVGIIAKVCLFLSENGINILDISQTIVQGYLNMVMIVDLSGSKAPFDEIYAGLKKVEEEIGAQILLQREDIFDSMHRI